MIRFSLAIPEGGRVRVKEGDMVEPSDVLFDTDETETILVDIAKKLSIDPVHIFSHLTKVIGDKVTEDDVVATKKNLLGTKKVKAPVSGRLESVNHETGEIGIVAHVVPVDDAPIKSRKIRAGISAHVASIDKKQVKFTAEKGSEFPIQKGAADIRGGVYHLTSDSLYFTLAEDDVAHKIVLAEDLKEHIAAKCEALGAAGFVMTEGKNDTEIPHVKIDKSVYTTIVKKKYDTIIASKSEKKLFAYSA